MPVMMKISKKIESPLENDAMPVCSYWRFYRVCRYIFRSADSAALPRWRQPFTILDDVAP